MLMRTTMPLITKLGQQLGPETSQSEHLKVGQRYHGNYADGGGRRWSVEHVAAIPGQRQEGERQASREGQQYIDL